MGRRGGRDATKRGNDRGQAARTRAGRPGKPKVCVFCASKAIWVDYKDVNTLRRLMSDRGKIKARRVTGTCRQHQRDVAVAIKTARELALLPYVLSPTNADKPGRRGGSRDGRSFARPADAAASADGESPDGEAAAADGAADDEGTEDVVLDDERVTVDAADRGES